MIKKISICFLILASCLSFSPLDARDSHRDSSRRDSGRRDVGRHDANRNWDRGRNWGRGRDRNWGNNWWYNRSYYPGYYSDYYYTDYYPNNTTYVYSNNYAGSFSITSSGLQDGAYIIYLANGMAFQISYPGYNPVGSYVDLYSQGDSTFSLVINGQSYSATRIK